MDWKEVFGVKELIIFLIGLIPTAIVYRMAKRDKEPHWAIQTVNLIKDYSGTVPDLTIQYKGEKVKDHLSVSKIVFWNRGGLTINRDDIVEANPLCVKAIGNRRILGAKVLAMNNTAHLPVLSATSDRDRIFLSFDYLDRGHGFVLQIIHEGTNSNNLQLEGALKGASTIRKLNLSSMFPYTTLKERRIALLKVVGQFIAAGMLSLALMAFAYHKWGVRNGILAIIGIGGAGTAVAAVIGAGFAIWGYSRQPPNGLEAFYTDPRSLDGSTDNRKYVQATTV